MNSHSVAQNQNQSLRYATHQLKTQIGMVAANAHQSGRATSAPSPRIVNVSQNIFRSIRSVYVHKCTVTKPPTNLSTRLRFLFQSERNRFRQV